MLDRGSSIFNFLRHLHSDFHSDRAKPQSHCRCTRVPRAPRRPRRLPSADFLMTAALTPVRRCLPVACFAFEAEPLCISLGHPFVLLGEMSVQVLCPFF